MCQGVRPGGDHRAVFAAGTFELGATVKEEMDFKAYAEGYDIRAAWLGQEFQRGNFTYKVAGLKISDPDKCVVLQRSDGARSQENGKLVARYLG